MACIASSNCDSYFKSLDRVQNYPIINDSLLYAIRYYQWLKSKNEMVGNTLSKAEKTLKTIKDVTEPIAIRKFGFIDDVLNNQLDLLERTYSIILESSNTIANFPGKICNDNLQYTLETMAWPIRKTMDTVTKTSKFTISTVSAVMELSFKKVLPSISATNYLSNKADEIIDRYFPEKSEAQYELLRGTDIFSKAQHLSRKTREKVYMSFVNQINILLTMTMEKLVNIQALIINVQEKKEAMEITLHQTYSHALESFKIIVQPFHLTNLKYLKETLDYVKNLQNLILTSVNVTIEYVLDHALCGLTLFNDNLFHLHNILSNSKPEFISKNFLIHTNDTICEIRIGLDSFVHNMREILKKYFHPEEMSVLKEIVDIHKKQFYLQTETDEECTDINEY